MDFAIWKTEMVLLIKCSVTQDGFECGQTLVVLICKTQHAIIFAPFFLTTVLNIKKLIFSVVYNAEPGSLNICAQCISFHAASQFIV